MDATEKTVDLEWVTNLYKEFIQEISIFQGDPIPQKLKDAITISKTFIQRLRLYIINKIFTSAREEICFFKHYKPKFYNFLFYYSEILEIVLKRPTGSSQSIKDYYLSETNRINQNFEKNKEFYVYYRSEAEYNDEHYFMRNSNSSIIFNGYLKEIDPDFSTGFDLLVAVHLSNEKIVDFLNKKIAQADNNTKSSDITNEPSKITWTDSKTALIEVIYALKAKGSFNNGKATLKEITDVFQTVFGVELTNPTRDFQEILRRKMGYSIFLDGLKERYIKYIEDIETRERR